MATQTSTSDAGFRATAEAWLAEARELSVHLRFSRAAGNCSFELFRSTDSFLARLDELSPRTFVSVFRCPQLPLRGRVDEAFIASALASIRDGDDYLVSSLELTVAGSHSWFGYWAGSTHAELRDDLEFCRGELVAVGPFPNWTLGADAVVNAIVPQPDGAVVPGVY